jgi:hypothetical protein
MQNVKKPSASSENLNMRINRKASSPSKTHLICVCHKNDFIGSIWTESCDFGVGIFSVHLWLSSFVYLQEADRWHAFVSLEGNLHPLCPSQTWLLSKYITFLHYNVTLRRVRAGTIAVEKRLVLHHLSVCICILRYPAHNEHASYFHVSCPALKLQDMTYLINGTILTWKCFLRGDSVKVARVSALLWRQNLGRDPDIEPHDVRTMLQQ